MFDRIQAAPAPALAILEELHPLAVPCARLWAAGWRETGDDLREQGVRDLASLNRFLEGYYRETLVALELPGVRRALMHSMRYQVRELIELDLELGATLIPTRLFASSCLAGRKQLQRLRGLRDERLVQRYIQAVENNQAPGQHTVVFGMVLALFSIPLRQGLLFYGHQSVSRLAESAAGSLPLPSERSGRVRDKLLERLPRDIDSVLAGGDFRRYVAVTTPNGL